MKCENKLKKIGNKKHNHIKTKRKYVKKTDTQGKCHEHDRHVILAWHYIENRKMNKTNHIEEIELWPKKK